MTVKESKIKDYSKTCGIDSHAIERRKAAGESTLRLAL